MKKVGQFSKVIGGVKVSFVGDCLTVQYERNGVKFRAIFVCMDEGGSHWKLMWMFGGAKNGRWASIDVGSGDVYNSVAVAEIVETSDIIIMANTDVGHETFCMGWDTSKEDLFTDCMDKITI